MTRRSRSSDQLQTVQPIRSVRAGVAARSASGRSAAREDIAKSRSATRQAASPRATPPAIGVAQPAQERDAVHGLRSQVPSCGDDLGSPTRLGQTRRREQHDQGRTTKQASRRDDQMRARVRKLPCGTLVRDVKRRCSSAWIERRVWDAEGRRFESARPVRAGEDPRRPPRAKEPSRRRGGSAPRRPLRHAADGQLARADHEVSVDRASGSRRARGAPPAESSPAPSTALTIAMPSAMCDAAFSSKSVS